MSNPSIVEDPTPAMPLNDLLLTKTPEQISMHHAIILDAVSLLCREYSAILIPYSESGG
jgi:hypothetical protein